MSKNKEPNIDLDENQKKLSEKLTRLQRLFVIYLVSPNMTQRKAYRKAGGRCKEERTIDAAAARMLADVRVRAFYDSLMKKAETGAVMEKNEALEKLTKKARIKITDVCTFKYVEVETSDGIEMQTVWKMKEEKDIDPDVAACIKSIQFTKQGPKIELYDSNQSIKLLSDMLGWNAPKAVDHSSSDGSMSPPQSWVVNPVAVKSNDSSDSD